MKKLKHRIQCKHFFIHLFLLLQVFFAVFCGQVRAELYMQVSGKVVDKETGEGVAKAKVILFSTVNQQSIGIQASTETNDQGKYIVDVVPPGEYSLIVESPKESNYALDLVPKNIIVKRGKNIIDLNFQLEIGGNVSGTIYGPDGITPLPNVFVLVLSPIGSKGAKTDIDGKYFINGLKTGIPLTVRTLIRGFGSVTRENISLLPNSTTIVDLVLGSGNSNVKGVIADNVGKPIQTGVFVTFISENGEVGKTLSDTQGRYSVLGLQPGTYKVVALGSGYKLLTVDSLAVSEGDNIRDFSMVQDLSGNPLDPQGDGILLGFSVSFSLVVPVGPYPGLNITGGTVEVALDGQAGTFGYFGFCSGFSISACGGIMEGYYMGEGFPTLESFCGEFEEFTGCVGPVCGTFWRGGGWIGTTVDFCYSPRIPIGWEKCTKCYKLLFQLAPLQPENFCPMCPCPTLDK